MYHEMDMEYYVCQCGRHFLTKEEKIEKLKKYKKWLDDESKGVHEAIEKIQKAS